jgi:hypothetical protein
MNSMRKRPCLKTRPNAPNRRTRFGCWRHRQPTPEAMKQPKKNDYGAICLEVSSGPLPFSCPLAATRGGKDAQAATQSESDNQRFSLGEMRQSGNFTQRAANGC